MTSSPHAVCIHGHFYQPPRENPWTERIDPQPSAAPFPDWNARVTHECYAPNTKARVLDDRGAILDITNNYKDISFNMGATLLAWLEQHRPDVYAGILEADRLGQAQFGGHGPALAQVYNHLIMPLACARDQHTQVLWGLRDFEHRFGRSPEGMWLAETAVDLHTLEALAAHGVRFTILAPHQAQRVRPLGGDASAWMRIEDQNNLDTSKAYIQNLPSGKQIILFFYDGPTSRAVAFEKLLDNGDRFAQRLITPLCLDDPAPQLSHIATDGESYGHHHTYGDMALAYAVKQLKANPRVSLTIYGEWLDAHPPEMEAQIAQHTSWSCAHGVERWRSDCGCQTGGPTHGDQRWREPLRAALDLLHDDVTLWFDEHGRELFSDPWGARDRYIEVLLEPTRLTEFLMRESAHKDVDEATLERMHECMELQRQLMLMYTSCGWFFHDLAGIETIQILRYAGRAKELYYKLTGKTMDLFVKTLERAVTHEGVTGDRLFTDEVIVPFVNKGLNQELVTLRASMAARFDLALDAWIAEPSNKEATLSMLKAINLRAHLKVDLPLEPYQERLMPGVERMREEVSGRDAMCLKRFNKIMEGMGFSSSLFV